MAETGDLKSFQCRFESDRGYNERVASVMWNATASYPDHVVRWQSRELCRAITAIG